MDIVYGRESYTGQPLEDLGIETFGERTLYAMQRLVPNNPLITMFGDAEAFSSWSSKKIIKAARAVENPYTEYLPVILAVSHVLGLKFYPFEPRKKSLALGTAVRTEISKAHAKHRKQAKKRFNNEITQERFEQDTLDYEEELSRALFKHFKPLYKIGLTDPETIPRQYEKRIRERGK